jgi:hypothetical protein
MAEAYEQPDVLRVIAGLSKQHTANVGDAILPTVCSDSYLRSVSPVKKKKWQKCSESGGY